MQNIISGANSPISPPIGFDDYLRQNPLPADTPPEIRNAPACEDQGETDELNEQDNCITKVNTGPDCSPAHEVAQLAAAEDEGAQETPAIIANAALSLSEAVPADGMLEAALAYAENFGPVLPLVPGRKNPLTPNGKDDASRDPDVIRQWWAQYPDANIGLLAGDDLLFVDFDPRNGGDVNALELPETLTATTASGGTHKVFRRPEGKLRAHLPEYEGIDYIRDRNYIVVAPSRIAPGIYGHMPDGGTYDWLDVGTPIADLPTWLVAKLSCSDAEAAIAAPDNLPDAPDERVEACFKAVAAMPAAVSGNGGDAATYRVAQECKRHGLSQGQALEMLAAAYNPRCEPPWLESALLRKVNCAYDATEGPAFDCLRTEAQAASIGQQLADAAAAVAKSSGSIGHSDFRLFR